jgi:hypothetical protein
VVIGFCYVAQRDTGHLMSTAAAGDRVVAPSPPPWLVVCHTLESLLVTSWPGQLFRVAVVPPGTPQEREALERAIEDFVPNVPFTRALAVDVLEVLPPTILFGPNGPAVVEVIDFAESLTYRVAAALTVARHPAANDAYSEVVKSWLATQPHRALDRPLVAHGLTVVYEEVWQSSRRRGGSGAFTTTYAPGNEDGEETLAEPWATAAKVLLDTAMVVGAPYFVSEREADILLTAWRSAAGRPEHGV